MSHPDFIEGQEAAHSGGILMANWTHREDSSSEQPPRARWASEPSPRRHVGSNCPRGTPLSELSTETTRGTQEAVTAIFLAGLCRGRPTRGPGRTCFIRAALEGAGVGSGEPERAGRPVV